MRRILFVVFSTALVWIVGGGCGSSTGPGNGDDLIAFTVVPDPGSLAFTAGESRSFTVTASDGGAVTAEWRLDGAVVGQNSVYPYLASGIGTHSLVLDVSRNGQTDSFTWTIHVDENVSTLPPPVTEVTITHAAAPAAVKVVWIRVTGSVNPIASYQVAASLTGQISEANWDQAAIVADRPETGSYTYSEIFTAAEDGLIPGDRVWFAVRAVDEFGQLSPLPSSYLHVMSYAWELEGHVRDDRGRAMPNVILKFYYRDQVANLTSGPDGYYKSVAFSSVDSVRVFALATSVDPSYYGFTSPFLKVGGGDYDLNLIEQTGADATCSDNGGDFLSYLRYMTLTSPISNQYRLFKWHDYPVMVYIPDYLREDGVDFAAEARAALAFWNQAVGADILVETPTQAEAKIYFDFTEVPAGINGQMVQVLPQESLGDAPPELVRIDINQDLQSLDLEATRIALRGVCLHELGHSLGLYQHSGCDGYRLMDTGNGVYAFVSGVDPIHADEIHAVRCIVNLPQGTDLSKYSDE